MDKKIYYPYKSNEGIYKYFIITKSGRKIRKGFGAFGYSDYTELYDNDRKLRYIKRHEKNENWNNIDCAGFWSRWLLWNKKTIKESYDDIKKRFL